MSPVKSVKYRTEYIDTAEHTVVLCQKLEGCPGLSAENGVAGYVPVPLKVFPERPFDERNIVPLCQDRGCDFDDSMAGVSPEVKLHLL